jgi:tetratricopeptide (TPR) repeat protein
MTEAIIAELAKIDSLNVISRTSVMRYKNRERPITEIAEELAVDRVVEGSVQREGDDVRITVQLIDGATDTHLWSNSYTNTITSVLKLQSEIALAIADEIRAVVTPEERTRINRAELVNREAYDLYLQGLSARADYSPIGQMRAHQLLSDSTAVDPDFAPAWSALASVNSSLAYMAVGSPMRQMEAAFQCARRAMNLDDSLGFPYIIQAVYSTLTEHNWESVQALVEKAVDLDPNDTDVLLGAANYNLIRGDWRAARRYAQKVISLDPNSEFRRPFAEMYMAWMGETERSVENLQSIVEDQPANLMGRFALGVSLVKAGRYEEARTQFERYTELVPQASGGYVGQASAAAAAGDAAGARALIDEILRRFSRASLHATVLPIAYIYLGEIDTALDWLEEAASTPNLQFYLALRIVPFGGAQQDDPHFVAFRNHPRYRALIDQMGFPRLPPSHPGYAEEQEWLAQMSGTDNN